MKARLLPSQQETVLLYRLNEGESAELQRILAQHRVLAREIPEESLGQTVAAFLVKEEAVRGEGKPCADAVMLFSGVAANKQQELLRALRGEGVGRDVIKAVVTPTNRSWTFEKLFQELAEEHARMTVQRRPDENGNGA